MSKANNSFLENGKYIKAMLMIFVVIGHSIAFWKGNWFTVVTCFDVNRIIVKISAFIGSFHVYGFFLISGYIYAYSKYEQHKYQTLLDFF